MANVFVVRFAKRHHSKTFTTNKNAYFFFLHLVFNIWSISIDYFNTSQKEKLWVINNTSNIVFIKLSISGDLTLYSPYL